MIAIFISSQSQISNTILGIQALNFQGVHNRVLTLCGRSLALGNEDVVIRNESNLKGVGLVNRTNFKAEGNH